MFEKITIVTTMFIVAMFAGIYHYQSGVNPPQECVLLHDDYTNLIQLIESDDYKTVANQLIAPDKKEYIYYIEKHYDRLLDKQFKRNGINDLKKICINARASLDLPTIIHVFDQYKHGGRQKAVNYTNRFII